MSYRHSNYPTLGTKVCLSHVPVTETQGPQLKEETLILPHVSIHGQLSSAQNSLGIGAKERGAHYGNRETEKEGAEEGRRLLQVTPQGHCVT